MRRLGWLLAVLVLFVASGGCETRDRSNPLDPYNNETGGLIDGFNALAGNRQVEIRWSRVKQNGLVGYRLLRWLVGDTPAVLEDHIASNLTGTVGFASWRSVRSVPASVWLSNEVRARMDSELPAPCVDAA